MSDYHKPNKVIKDFEFIPQPTVPTIDKWWIQGLLPKRRLTLLSAMGGTGKTSLAAFLAKRLARESTAHVAYWSFEETPQDFTNKIGKTDLLYFMHEKEERPIDLAKEDDCITLNNFLYDNGIDVLIIDPISALLSGDTNDNQKVRAMMNPLLKMTEDIGLTILGIHHFRKPGHSGGGSARGNIMGASAWVDTARHVLSLVQNDSGQRFLEVVKSNISKTGASWEVFMEANENGAYVVTDIVPTDDFSAQRALDKPEEEKLTPVIKNLKDEFAIGEKFNLNDVARLGNVKSFYNWAKKNPLSYQVCDTKKDGKKAFIFV